MERLKLSFVNRVCAGERMRDSKSVPAVIGPFENRVVVRHPLVVPLAGR
jgi:hypothetical protein